MNYENMPVEKLENADIMVINAHYRRYSMDRFLSHIAENGREQTIYDHLHQTAALSEQFAAAFDASEQGRVCGLLHDIGKYSEEFQKRLVGGSKVDHATAGANECFKQKMPLSAMCIMGHHSGLPDIGTKADTSGMPTFWGRINKAKAQKLPDYQIWEKEITSDFSCKEPRFNGENTYFASNIYVRMLYSCLVDADYLDTESFMSSAPVERGCGLNIEDLDRIFSDYIRQWKTEDNELNRLRTEIRKACEDAGTHADKGLFTLTVPTGGGKTLSSLDFALKHAVSQGMSRIIYVIPYTSIIDQTAAKFREIFGSECVLEHHSNVEFDSDSELTPETMRLRLAEENWDMPIIITTAVQFFESLFSNKSSKCRKLHNIANSVIILDEAQLLPLPYLKPCLFTIAELVKNYNISAVLCTATQPVLLPVIHKYWQDAVLHEICPVGISESPVFQRVTFDDIGILTWDELISRMNREKQVLCIVNSRKHAREVYSGLEPEGSFHLSTLMCPEDRKQTIAEIRRRLNANETCRVISTSLIEAGVDVDFPMVYREENGLDSILQAGGRCNREGKRSAKESYVHVFKTDERILPVFAVPCGAFRETERQHADWSQSNAVHFYFEQLLDLLGQSYQDTKNILKLIDELKFPFKTIAEEFHLIESNERTIYIPIRKGEELVQRLRYGERTKQLFRELGLFSISVFERDYNYLLQIGSIELIESNYAVLTDIALYTPETGLSVDTESGKALFI